MPDQMTYEFAKYKWTRNCKEICKRNTIITSTKRMEIKRNKEDNNLIFTLQIYGLRLRNWFETNQKQSLRTHTLSKCEILNSICSFEITDIKNLLLGKPSKWMKGKFMLMQTLYPSTATFIILMAKSALFTWNNCYFL